MSSTDTSENVQKWTRLFSFLLPTRPSVLNVFACIGYIVKPKKYVKDC